MVFHQTAIITAGISVVALSAALGLTIGVVQAQQTVPESALQGPSFSLKGDGAGQARMAASATPTSRPPLPGAPVGDDDTQAPPSQPSTPAPASPQVSAPPPAASGPADRMSQVYISGLQRALPSHGYRTGPQTGTLDPVTEAAIEQYQRDANLTQDVGSPMGLKAALDSVSFVRPPIMAREHHPIQPAYSSPPPVSIRWVQERLNAKGYEVGPPDGVMGRRTADAIIGFEAKHGLPRQAAITPQLVEQLKR